MLSPEELKLVVKNKYGEIADQSKEQNASSCCGVGSDCCSDDGMSYTIMAEDYTAQPGYNPDADLALGCGLPTAHAGIREGMTVLDLGSGAGNDVFLAAHAVGPSGMAIGVDMTESMIAKANANKEKLGAANVEFRLGEIEALPVEPDTVDVVLSNCVLNLVPDKQQAFREIARVLKPGGWFTISDIVVEGTMSEELRSVAELYAGCVSGAEQKDVYLGFIREAGFDSIEVLAEKTIEIPESILESVASALPPGQRSLAGARIFSITVKALKRNA